MKNFFVVKNSTNKSTESPKELENSTNKSTESPKELENTKIINFPINKYDVKIIVDENNKFIGIGEVKINKDFLADKLKSSQKGFHDVAEFYKE